MISALSGLACENFLVSGNIIENKLISPQARGNTNPRGGGGGGIFPYVGYTGMCRSTGYAFCLSDSGTGYKDQPLTLEEGIFYLRFDSGTRSIFPKNLINHDKV